MDKEKKNTRFIGSMLSPFILGCIFIALFYGSYYYFLPSDFSLSSQKLMDFYSKYSQFIPLGIGIISIIISYLFVLITSIIKLSFWFIRLIIILGMYGFLLIFGIQLQFYEPRYTETAIFIIDLYSWPMIIASLGTIILSFVFIFIKKKSI